MRSSFLQEFQRAARISQRDRQRRGVGDAAREHVISPISRAARKVVVAIVAPSSNSPRATSTASVASRTGNQRKHISGYLGATREFRHTCKDLVPRSKVNEEIGGHAPYGELNILHAAT
jgi:hypothetical protein